MHITHAHIEPDDVIGSHTQVAVTVCVATNNWVASSRTLVIIVMYALM